MYKQANKILYNILHKRGFVDSNLLEKWNTINTEAQNFFPVRIKNTTGQNCTLYIKPKNKMAAVTFIYNKKGIIIALKQNGFTNITDLKLVAGS